MVVRAEVGSVRLAELVATLSYAADLGRGQPMEHCMRKTAISLRMADRLGLEGDDRVATYYMGLLLGVYCHADAYEQAEWFGDDIGTKAEGLESMGLRLYQTVPRMMRRVGSNASGLERVRKVVTFPTAGFKAFSSWARTHSELASEFAQRIGLGDAVAAALLRTYEQWDGKGFPGEIEGEEIPIGARLTQLADTIEITSRVRGLESARAVAQKLRGVNYDPALVDLFLSESEALLDGLDEASSWEAILDAEPRLEPRVHGEKLDDALEAMADLIDMKTPYFAGHSRGVANLAAEAGQVAGVPGEDVTVLRRAGLLHDFGRLGVSNEVWDKEGPLTAAQMERVRLHPYLTDRMLANVPALARSRELAARNHERLDGSGYPAGLSGGALTPLDRLLAAADVYHAMTEPRPHRDALEPDAAAKELLAEAKAGRLDGDAVNSVLKAAGHRAPARREWPAGLTAREVEVLGLLARGQSNKEIAQRLVVTPKTVSNHVEHIYTKLEVSTRAAATLFATRHGLVGSFEATG
jgi:HD-GYP domain-containing protein (c-di-GMP phosphodiesterase class II)